MLLNIIKKSLPIAETLTNTNSIKTLEYMANYYSQGMLPVA